MAGAGRWVFGPSQAAVQAFNAAEQGVSGLVHYGKLVGFGEFPLLLPGLVQGCDGLADGRIDVAAQGHPVPQVVGQQFHPLVEPAAVQQAGLPVQELFNLGEQVGRYLQVGCLMIWWLVAGVNMVVLR